MLVRYSVLFGLLLSGWFAAGDCYAQPTLPDIYFGTQVDEDFLCENDGTGQYTCAVVPDNTSFTTNLITADFNQDGITDFVKTNFFGVSEICLVNDDATFVCTEIDSDGPATYSAALVDPDEDGDSDLVLALGFSQNLYCENLGDGELDCSPLGLNAFTTLGIVAIDANGDEFQDLVFANRGNAGVLEANEVCLGGPGSTFTCSEFPGDSSVSFNVKTGHFNDDDLTDVVFANSDEPNNVCFNNGDGTFDCQSIDAAPGESRAIAVADYDGNGLDDIVFGNSGNAVNRICFQDSFGQFNCTDLAPSFARNTTSTNAADVDADGDIDLVITDFGQIPILGRNDGLGNFEFEDIGTIAGNVNASAFLEFGVPSATLQPDLADRAPKFFPNPTSGQLNWTLRPGQLAPVYLEIRNIAGQRLRGWSNPASPLSLGDLAGGLYLLYQYDTRGIPIRVQRIVVNR